MSETLLPYYERELSFIRQVAGQFAQQHPGLARSLGVSAEGVDDPHVARMVESFALLNARLSKRLDDQFPELSDALLELIYPHCTRPLPATAVMQVPGEELVSQSSLPRGSYFEAGIDEERFCTLRTARTLDALPATIAQLTTQTAPFSLQRPNRIGSSEALIQLDLQLNDETASWQHLELDQISFYLKGEPQHTWRLYDLLFSQLAGVAVNTPQGLIALPDGCIEPVGMHSEDRLLPQPGNSFHGYQLLQEFFAWPDSFMYFRLSGLKAALSRLDGPECQLVLFFRQAPVELLRALGPQHFQLNTVPLINLYEERAEPIQIDHQQLDYPVVAGLRNANESRIYSVDRVLDTQADGQQALPRLFAARYHSPEAGVYWHYRAADGEYGQTGGALNLLDLALNPAAAERRTLLPEVTLSNGNQVRELGVQSPLRCLENFALDAQPVLLQRPGASMPASTGQAGRWKLLALLQLNFYTLFNADDPKTELKQLLSVHQLPGQAHTQLYIDAIVELSTRQVVAPLVINGSHCFAQGVEIHLTLDMEKLSAAPVMLFVQVLDHFFAHFAGFNSFTQLHVHRAGQPGVYCQCPVRNGLHPGL